MSNGTVSVGYLVNELVISGRANGSCSLAALTCLVYEYALTFPEEVELFWRRGLSGASVLFFVNRYLALVVFAYLNPPKSASWAVQVCHFWFFVFNQVLAVLPFLPIAAFSALRVYAFSECCLVPAFAVFVLSCSPFVINLARVQWLTSSPDPVWGCDPSLSAVPPSYIFPLVIAARVPTIVADAIVIGYIVVAAYKAKTLMKGTGPSGPSFLGLLLRDGCLYFTVLLVLNLLHFTLSALQVNANYTGGASNVTDFTLPISNILVSRSLLNLQRMERGLSSGSILADGSGLPVQSTASFASGSLRFEHHHDQTGPDAMPPAEGTTSSGSATPDLELESRQSEIAQGEGSSRVAVVPI